MCSSDLIAVLRDSAEGIVLIELIQHLVNLFKACRDLEEIEGYIADQKTVEDEIEARELARIIGDFLDTLTLENRVIFMRRYWFADSYKDIAEFMGLSEKNISVRLTRIREKMKQYLIGREVFV